MTAQDRGLVLVTGGAGFIGSHVSQQLLDRGWRVRVFDNFYRPDQDRLVALREHPHFEVVEGDVRYRALLDKAVRGADRVVHLAALAINKSVAAPTESFDVNLMGTQHVVEAACDAAIPRVIFASSASVYGDPKRLPMSETDDPDPRTPYCISKLAGEHMLRFYADTRGLTWLALRFFNVYGPGQRTDAYYTSVVLTFLRRIANGDPPVIDGDGEQSMDFIHVHDIARSVVAALESDATGEVLNVGTGLQTTIRDLARILIKHMGADVEPVFRPRPVLVSRRAADISKIRALLDWAPSVTVDDGLRTVVDSFKAELG